VQWVEQVFVPGKVLARLFTVVSVGGVVFVRMLGFLCEVDLIVQSRDAHDRAYHVNSTCCHELGHATGHSTRLNRTFGTKYGTEAYCFEEVCAELVSSYMAAHLGLASHPRIDHAQYISHFVTLMKKDNRAIFAAAAKASEATNYLLAFLRQEQAHAA
jgi:antirestriction protein ArdC